MDGTLRKLQLLLQLSATEERRKTTQKLKKNQLVPTGQSAIKLTDLIQQIETVAPEVIYVQKTLFKQSNYPISSNLSHFCTCLTRSSALAVCEKVVNIPVELQCNHLMCKKCAIQHLHQSPLYDCSQCQQLYKKHIKSPPIASLQ